MSEENSRDQEHCRAPGAEGISSLPSIFQRCAVAEFTTVFCLRILSLKTSKTQTKNEWGNKWSKLGNSLKELCYFIGVCLYVWLNLCSCVIKFPGAARCGYWEPSSGPWEEQQIVLILRFLFSPQMGNLWLLNLCGIAKQERYRFSQ